MTKQGMDSAFTPTGHVVRKNNVTCRGIPRRGTSAEWQIIINVMLNLVQHP